MFGPGPVPTVREVRFVDGVRRGAVGVVPLATHRADGGRSDGAGAEEVERDAVSVRVVP